MKYVKEVRLEWLFGQNLRQDIASYIRSIPGEKDHSYPTKSVTGPSENIMLVISCEALRERRAAKRETSLAKKRDKPGSSLSAPCHCWRPPLFRAPIPLSLVLQHRTVFSSKRPPVTAHGKTGAPCQTAELT